MIVFTIHHPVSNDVVIVGKTTTKYYLGRLKKLLTRPSHSKPEVLNFMETFKDSKLEVSYLDVEDSQGEVLLYNLIFVNRKWLISYPSSKIMLEEEMLQILEKNPEATNPLLSKELGVSKETISKTIKDLESRGIISREIKNDFYQHNIAGRLVFCKKRIITCNIKKLNRLQNHSKQMAKTWSELSSLPWNVVPL